MEVIISAWLRLGDVCIGAESAPAIVVGSVCARILKVLLQVVRGGVRNPL